MVEKTQNEIPVRNPYESVKENPRSDSSVIKGAHSNAQTAKSRVSKKGRTYRMPRTSQKFSGTVIENK